MERGRLILDLRSWHGNAAFQQKKEEKCNEQDDGGWMNPTALTSTFSAMLVRLGLRFPAATAETLLSTGPALHNCTSSPLQLTFLFWNGTVDERYTPPIHISQLHLDICSASSAPSFSLLLSQSAADTQIEPPEGVWWGSLQTRVTCRFAILNLDVSVYAMPRS